MDKIHLLADSLSTRFNELQKMVSDPSLHQNSSYASISKEYHTLSKKMCQVNEWKKIKEELQHLLEIVDSNDSELADLARLEKEDLQKKCSLMEKELLKSLVSSDPNDDKNIVLELRAGTGGEESALFAEELSRMYLKYAQSKGFVCETVHLNTTDHGGFKEAIFFIESKGNEMGSAGVFSFFKYESGVHRVQRVPKTEASGRIHTSTVTVAVLPEAEEVDIEVRPEDLRVDTYRASGHGGQYLQKTDSAVRITHLPSGLVVQCQDERSQQKNRVKAMKILRAKLLELVQENQRKKIAHDRKKQVGTADRSEKIRTYNFPQDRITDHRIGFSTRYIQKVLEGELDPIIEALSQAEEREKKC